MHILTLVLQAMSRKFEYGLDPSGALESTPRTTTRYPLHILCVACSCKHLVVINLLLLLLTGALEMVDLHLPL